MINKKDIIQEYKEMFSVTFEDLTKKAEYYILNDLRRRSTFDKVAEINYSIIDNFLDSEIKHFLNVEERNELLRFIEQSYFSPDQVEFLKDNLTEQDLINQDFYLDILYCDLYRIIKLKEKELYNQIKEELEHYKNR